MKSIRTLNAEEIDCRVGSVFQPQKAVSILLYKDARVDQTILDEVYGSNNWQRTHELIGGELYCNIDVWCDTKKCWVRKQDVGTESYTEKEKGRASDSFKRAGFNVGIGRELYSAPFIYIKCSDSEWRNGKPALYLHVSEVGYSDTRKINSLVIKDDKGKVRFQLDAPAEVIESEVEELTANETQIAGEIRKANSIAQIMESFEKGKSIFADQNRLTELCTARKLEIQGGAK